MVTNKHIKGAKERYMNALEHMSNTDFDNLPADRDDNGIPDVAEGAAQMKSGGAVPENRIELRAKWRKLVNMSSSELKEFYDSEEGKKAGLSSAEANRQGIDSGRESARWILKMKATPVQKWTPAMWKWAGKQISFISRMSGVQGDLYDDKGRKTRKHLALLIWGHNPAKKNAGGHITPEEKKPEIDYSASPSVFSNQLEAKYGISVSLVGTAGKGDLTLSKIAVPKDSRGQGVGSKAMEDIVRYADANGQRIVLSPSTDFGGSSVSRLKEFYKRFGFVENKGRNRDYSTKEDMYRDAHMAHGGSIEDPSLNEPPTVEEIADKHGIEPEYVLEQLSRGQKEEMEHTDDPETARAIAMQHLYERPDYYIVLEKAMAQEFKKGGAVKDFDPDSKQLKDKAVSMSGQTGGVLVGKRHSEGGIDAVVKSTGQPIEMEGGEVVITRNAVSDEKKREFEGEMLTNRQILSRINESGGGVSFAEGGDIPEKCRCSGKEYKYGGKTYKDFDLVDEINRMYDFSYEGVTYMHLPHAEAIKRIYEPVFEQGGGVGSITMFNKRLPSFRDFQALYPEFDDYIMRSEYYKHLREVHDIIFSELPSAFRNALMLNNQLLIDNHLNEG